MKQDAQIKMMMGIGAGIVAVAAAGFGINAYLDKKDTTPTRSVVVPAAVSTEAADYSAAINTAAESAGSGTSLTAEEAKRIGEEVARQVAEQVARTVVEQSLAAAAPAAAGGEGLSEVDARRIGAEEGRRVAQEVTAVMLQNASAGSSGSSDGSGMTAAEAEQIGMAAGRRAAEQVAASTAREVVRSEFGGSVAAKPQVAKTEAVADSKPAKPKAANPQPAARQAPPPDALKPWWTSPADGEFGLITANQSKARLGIALLFSDVPGDGALQDSIKVYNVKGVRVSGKWTRASNQRLVQLHGLKPGRYTVVIDRSFASKRGKVINKAAHGPVYVQ